jgi:hypothetical protein
MPHAEPTSGDYAVSKKVETPTQIRVMDLEGQAWTIPVGSLLQTQLQRDHNLGWPIPHLPKPLIRQPQELHDFLQGEVAEDLDVIFAKAYAGWRPGDGKGAFTLWRVGQWMRLRERLRAKS